MKPLTAWSYSRWHTFETCPFKFLGEVIEGHREPQSEAQIRGDRMHKEIEAYIMQPPEGQLPVPLSVITHFDDLVRGVRALPRKMAEFQISFTKTWNSTGWMSANVWMRNKLDVFALYADDTAEVIDWKSGKQYDEHKDQLETYGLVALMWKRTISYVRTRMAYLDTGEETVYEFTRDDLDALKAKWTDRANQMLGATEFPARPNSLCRFCWRRQDGGDKSCKFG